MNRLAVLCLLFALLHPLEARAIWPKVIGAISDASKAAAKATPSPRALDAVLAGTARGRPMRSLHRADGNIVSRDAAGKEVLVAAAAGGALTLTEEGAAILRTVELIIPEVELPSMEGFLKQASALGSHKPIRLVREDGSMGRVLVKQSNGQSLLLAEQYKGVFVQVASAHADELKWALQQPLHRTGIEVVSLFDEADADVLRALDDSVGNLHRPRAQASAQALADSIRGQRQKSVFVVGHVEGDSFVVRDAAGVRKNSIPISELEDAAREADSTIFMLGCETGVCSVSSGPIVPVNALDLAAGLREAIRQQTVGDALSALSSNGGDMLIRPDIVNPIRTVMHAEQKADALESKAKVVVRVGMLARSRSEELAARIIPLIPSWIQFAYLGGLVLLVFSARQLWREWRAMRIPAPRFAYRPFTSLSVHGVRIGGLMLLMPFATVLCFFILVATWVLAIAFGILATPFAAAVSAFFGWRLWRIHREETADEAWLRRFWIIAAFCALVPMLSTQILEFVYLRLPHEPGSEPPGFWWLAPGLVAAGLSYALLWLLRRIGHNPNGIFDLIMGAPIAITELAAARLIGPSRREELV